jgi:hypothetical protein
LRFVERYTVAVPAEAFGVREITRTFSIVGKESSSLKILCALIFINGFCGAARGNYSNIFFTEALGVSAAAISILPGIVSLVLVILILAGTSLFKASAATRFVRSAFWLMFAADMATACAPRANLWWLAGVSVAAGLGGFLLQAILAATIMNISKKEHWPYLIGLNVPLFSVAGIIAAPLMGMLYEYHPRAPFVVSAILSGVCVFLAFRGDFSGGRNILQGNAADTVAQEAQPSAISRR